MTFQIQVNEHYSVEHFLKILHAQAQEGLHAWLLQTWTVEPDSLGLNPGFAIYFGT